MKHGNFADRSLREGSAVGEIGKSHKAKPYLGDKQQGLFTYAHATWNDGFATTAPVGSYLPNAWGLHDMHGNMAELTSTPYDAERKALSAPDSKSGLGWVIKGGGWLSTADYCRCAFRGQSLPVRENYMGLRILLRQKVKA
jgi:formylglycine-generating enzyme required for sulfatase activity